MWFDRLQKVLGRMPWATGWVFGLGQMCEILPGVMAMAGFHQVHLVMSG